MLKIRDLHVAYGNIQALRGIDLDVNEGEIVAILGPNGAGKSTLIKTIIGVLSCRRGSIAFQGGAIDATTTVRRIRLGLGTNSGRTTAFSRDERAREFDSWGLRAIGNANPGRAG